MTLRFVDSFDATSDWSKKWTSATIAGSSTYQATGREGKGLHLDSTNHFLYKGLVDPLQTWIGGAAFWTNVQSAGGGYMTYTNIMRFNRDNSTNPSVMLTFASDSRLCIYKNNSTIIGYGTTVPNSAWMYIEMKVKVDPTNGGVWVRVNGQDNIRLGCYAESPTTLDLGSTYYNGMNLGMGLNAIGGYNRYWDDVYICDTTGSVANDFLGDSVVTALHPNGAGSNTDFSVVGAASNWDAVNEGPAASDSDYVQSSQDGDIDTYAFEDLTSNYFSVSGVVLSGRVTKADAGNRAVALAARTGGNEYFGSDYYLGTPSWAGNEKIWTTNPDTGAAWTIDEINAAEFGLKVTV